MWFQILEEKSVENAKVENEVILLRKKIARGLNRNPNSPGIVSYVELIELTHCGLRMP